MCGRFVITHPSDALARLFEAAPDNDLPPTPDYNVCPTVPVHAVISAEGRRLQSHRWGLIPHWAKSETEGPLLINARAETLAEKPAFREAARQRRCLIPATGFYEWTKGEGGARLPWYIRPADDEPLVFAGLWQDWQGMRTCAIVTCTANDELSRLHHRMPVILAPGDWALWLGEAGHGAARLMRPLPKGRLRIHRVNSKVNSNRASGADLVEPVDT